MAKKEINWKELEKKQGKVVSTGSGANVIHLEKGESFLGQYIGSEQVQIADNEPFTSFKFLTEKGEQAFSGGMSFASQMRMVNINSIIRVTFTGKKKTASGFKANQYTIELLVGEVNEKEKKKIQQEIQDAMKKKKSTKKGKK